MGTAESTQRSEAIQNKETTTAAPGVPFTNTASPDARQGIEPGAGPPRQNTPQATESAPIAVTGTHLARKP